MNQNIREKINIFLRQYLEMDIKGTIVNCPYFMNRLKGGRVVIRGFASGKGGADDIRKEIIRRLDTLPKGARFPITAENLRKLVRRERIGIDCSGFAYRLLSHLVYLKYKDVQISSLEKVFQGGINKTNARTLTNLAYCVRIDDISDLQLGDMIRLWGGKHVVIIIDIIDNRIIYAHSSHLSTQIQGVHKSEIRIADRNKSLAEQDWLEKTGKGENFGKKYFKPQAGDGIFRLKVFA